MEPTRPRSTSSALQRARSLRQTYAKIKSNQSYAPSRPLSEEVDHGANQIGVGFVTTPVLAARIAEPVSILAQLEVENRFYERMHALLPPADPPQQTISKKYAPNSNSSPRAPLTQTKLRSPRGRTLQHLLPAPPTTAIPPKFVSGSRRAHASVLSKLERARAEDAELKKQEAIAAAVECRDIAPPQREYSQRLLADLPPLPSYRPDDSTVVVIDSWLSTHSSPSRDSRAKEAKQLLTDIVIFTSAMVLSTRLTAIVKNRLNSERLQALYARGDFRRHTVTLEDKTELSLPPKRNVRAFGFAAKFMWTLLLNNKQRYSANVIVDFLQAHKYCARTMLSVFAKFKYRVRSSQRIWRARRACWLARVDALCRLWSSLEPAIRLEYTTAANNQRSDELWESSVGALLSRMHAEFAPDSTAMASLTPLTQFMLRSRHARRRRRSELMTLLEGIVAGTVTTATLSLDSGYGLTSEERMLLFGTRQVIVPQIDSELRTSVIPSVPIPPPDTHPDETLQRYRRSSLGRRRGSGVVLPNPDVLVDGLSCLTSDEAVEDLPTAVSVDITDEVASLSVPTPVPAPSASEMKRAAVTRYLCMKRSQFIQEEILSWKYSAFDSRRRKLQLSVEDARALVTLPHQASQALLERKWTQHHFQRLQYPTFRLFSKYFDKKEFETLILEHVMATEMLSAK